MMTPSTSAKPSTSRLADVKAKMGQTPVIRRHSFVYSFLTLLVTYAFFLLPASGPQTLTLYRREQLAEIDRIVVTPLAGFDPAGLPSGYESLRATNTAPQLDGIGPQLTAEGASLTIPLSASDPVDNDALAFSAPNLPAFAVLNDNADGTGSIVVNAGGGAAGIYALTVTVTDDGPGNQSVSETFSLVVQP